MRIVSASLIILTACGAFGQSATAPIAFEVASVKPNKSGSNSSSEKERNGRLTAVNISLKDCIKFAYKLRDYQIVGPDWLGSERYDISAKAESDVPGDQLGVMFQALLMDRFKLAVHREKKDCPMYALVAGKNGPKLHEAEAGGSQSSTERSRGHLTALRISMPTLAEALSAEVDRPVTDMTGLKGAFDLTLEWAPGESQWDARVIADSAAKPSIFTALQQQLGLKLEARKGPIEVLVIDHAERVPAEN